MESQKLLLTSIVFVCLMCFLASFFLKDPPAERRASIVFGLYFGAVLLVKLTENYLTPSESMLGSVVFNLLMTCVIVLLPLALMWRSHSKIPDYVPFIIGALYLFLVVFFNAFTTFALLLGHSISKGIAAYVVWNRKPHRNKADTAIFVILLSISAFAFMNIVFLVESYINLNIVVPAALSGFTIFLLASYMIDSHEELQKLASTDPMTGLYNRRAFHTLSDNALHLATRQKTPTTIAMCDLDFFKQVNDSYGHDVGDEVIIKFADILKSSVREIDIVARYGGEEFIILFPCTTIDGARNVVERMRKHAEASAIQLDTKVLNFTASFGITEMSPGTEFSEAVKTVDQALYKAKEEGRNRVCVASIA